MLDYNKAVKLMNKYEPIHCSGFRWLLLIRTMLKEEQAIMLFPEWCNYRRSEIKTALYVEPDIHKETTYENCIKIEIKADKNSILLTLLIYDGDACEGYPTKLRCRFLIQLKELTKEFDSVLMEHVHKQAEYAINREDEKERQRRVKNMANFILEAL